MHRRALHLLVAVLLAVLTVAVPGALAHAGTDQEPEPVPERTVPPIADNEFLPQDANLSDCVGFVERPGCGSEARGGLQQTLIFVALAVGLAVIFWRVSVGVRRNRAAADAGAGADAETTR